VWIGGINLARGLRENLVHIAPAEERVGGEDQGHSSGRERRGRGSATKRICIVAITRISRDKRVVTTGAGHIRGDNTQRAAVARSRDEQVAPRIAVKGLIPKVVDRSDRRHISAIGN